jgi:hypothetical protein
VGRRTKDIVIRHAKPADYQYIVGVVDAWWGGRRMADMLPKIFFVHFRANSFVAACDEKIVGFVNGFVSQTFPEEAYIHFVGVHPEFRKEGLARTLYQSFFVAASELGCHTVRCVTSPVNKGSISFHLRMGFTVEASRKIIDGVCVVEDCDGEGEDRVLFSKSLVEMKGGGDE